MSNELGTVLIKWRFNNISVHLSAFDIERGILSRLKQFLLRRGIISSVSQLPPVSKTLTISYAAVLQNPCYLSYNGNTGPQFLLWSGGIAKFVF
jgi:hypothetical protein